MMIDAYGASELLFTGKFKTLLALVLLCQCQWQCARAAPVAVPVAVPSAAESAQEPAIVRDTGRRSLFGVVTQLQARSKPDNGHPTSESDTARLSATVTVSDCAGRAVTTCVLLQPWHISIVWLEGLGWMAAAAVACACHDSRLSHCSVCGLPFKACPAAVAASFDHCRPYIYQYNVYTMMAMPVHSRMF